jgi:hypothetical protein
MQSPKTLVECLHLIGNLRGKGVSDPWNLTDVRDTDTLIIVLFVLNLLEPVSLEHGLACQGTNNPVIRALG